MGRTVGIDLGTTNSVIAFIDGDTPKVIKNSEGYAITPSIVAFVENGDLLVGEGAKNQAVLNPQQTISSAKRLIGRKFLDVQGELQYLSYVVTKGENDSARIGAAGRIIPPEEIGAVILKKLILDAAEYLGEPITDAVITVPAYFDDAQRQATKHAGEIVGLNVLRIINEPTAAALAFGNIKSERRKILVFDLGGGTLDVTALDIEGNVCEVLATSGDTHLGGDDFTHALYLWVIKKLDSECKKVAETSPQHRQRLFEAVEKVKCELSSNQTTSIELPFFVQTESGPKHLQLPITRTELEEATRELAARCITPLERALVDSKLSSKDFDEILLVGGATRMPRIRALVRELMDGKEPNTSLNPDEVVAMGAAIQAGIINGEIQDLVLVDVTPFSLVVETADDTVEQIVPRNTRIPVRMTRYFSTAESFQRSADIIIRQGESKRATENKELGRFALDGLKAHVKGDARIEISFDINENGILIVSAAEIETGRQQEITIKGASLLSREERSQLKGYLKRLK